MSQGALALAEPIPAARRQALIDGHSQTEFRPPWLIGTNVERISCAPVQRLARLRAVICRDARDYREVEPCSELTPRGAILVDPDDAALLGRLIAGDRLRAHKLPPEPPPCDEPWLSDAHVLALEQRVEWWNGRWWMGRFIDPPMTDAEGAELVAAGDLVEEDPCDI